MLTRPLAFKGPVDHLSQFFELPTLYEGVQLLLLDRLRDWQYQAEAELASGHFSDSGQQLSCRLAWPLSANEETSCCHCQGEQRQLALSLDSQAPMADSAIKRHCAHLAALAIETKMRLERLPQPLKPTQQFASETAYLEDWLAKQRFDPYPNMARHRVIYLLDGDGDSLHISVHKGYLSQQQEYQRKSELELDIVKRDKLPKFISLTDQHILHQANALISQTPAMQVSAHSFYLQFPGSDTLLRDIVASNRCFWRSCHRQPLSWAREDRIVEGAHLLNQGLWFDKAHNRLVQIDEPMPARAKALFTLLEQQPDATLVPQLTITSEAIYLPWQTQPQVELQGNELEVAKIHFTLGDITFSLQEGIRWCQHQSTTLARTLFERLAEFVHQVDWLPSLAAHFEAPVWRELDVTTRYLHSELSHWFVLFRALQVKGWQINFDPQFRLNQRLVDDWYSKVTDPKVATKHTGHSGQWSQGVEDRRWFELELGVVVDGQTVNLLPLIVQALKRGQWQHASTNPHQVLTLEDGTRIQLANQRIQNILANLVELWEKKPLNENQRLKLPATQFVRLLSLETQLNRQTDWQDLDWLKQKAQRLDRLARLDQTDVKAARIDQVEHVHATLRDYQRQGVYWLQVLREEGLNGILADDMGLGKTLQTLVHLQLEKNSGRLLSPCMVVAPTSLLGNWHAEARRFTPELKVLRWSGSARHQQQGELLECDLIITSYGVLARDAELLNSLSLYLLVLDEAQTIKNTRSRVARLSYTMHAKHRLCLTGTPLENHLGELWSLYHFLMPGFLGDQAQFKRLFQQPIEKEQDWQRQKVLSQRVAPFMLRRTKATVATDLPKKTVIEEVVELTEQQADLYESTRLLMVEEVQKALQGQGQGRNSLMIGNALLRLRQICCHPQLINGRLKSQGNLSAGSAKLDWLLTLLPEMLESGQKVLIFSSFTRMLDIIAEALHKKAIPHLTLTGQTRRRSELVARFQAGEVPVFLISLKAGGAGLNLTRADTVIHFDPWWNPAAEEQASDRAHRIGQDKPVFVYKLISQGTVEERIQLMQSQKQQLADQLYRAKSEATFSSETDWELLLAPLEN